MYDEYSNSDPFKENILIRNQSTTQQDQMYINEDKYSFCDGLSEDRQWDSGGRGTSMNKVLPKIPIKHSNSVNDDTLIYGEEIGNNIGGRILLPAIPSIAQLLPIVGPKKTRLLPNPCHHGNKFKVDASGTEVVHIQTQQRMLPTMPLRHKLRQTPLVRRQMDTDYSDQVCVFTY